MDDNIPTNEKAMGVIITNTKADGMLTYDAVRRAWRLTDEQLAKANRARYVLAIEHGTVVDIFEKHRGPESLCDSAPYGCFRPSTDEPGRYTFTPIPVTDINVRRLYIGRRYRSYGQAVIFFGFDGEK